MTQLLGVLSAGDSEFQSDVFCTAYNQVRAYRNRL